MSTKAPTPAPSAGEPAEPRRSGEGADSALSAMLKKRREAATGVPDSEPQQAQQPQAKPPKG